MAAGVMTTAERAWYDRAGVCSVCDGEAGVAVMDDPGRPGMTPAERADCYRAGIKIANLMCLRHGRPWHLDPFDDRFTRCCPAAEEAGRATPETMARIMAGLGPLMLFARRPLPLWLRVVRAVFGGRRA